MLLSASEAAQRIRDGVLTSEELVQGCLERIRALEPKVQAWTFLDEEHALVVPFLANDSADDTLGMRCRAIWIERGQRDMPYHQLCFRARQNIPEGRQSEASSTASGVSKSALK